MFGLRFEKLTKKYLYLPWVYFNKVLWKSAANFNPSWQITFTLEYKLQRRGKKLISVYRQTAIFVYLWKGYMCICVLWNYTWSDPNLLTELCNRASLPCFILHTYSSTIFYNDVISLWINGLKIVFEVGSSYNSASQSQTNTIPSLSRLYLYISSTSLSSFIISLVG